MKPALVVNPRAGRGAAARTWKRYGIRCETSLTREPGDAVRLAREYADAGFDPVIAAGGDGTVHEVANGVLAASRRPAVGVLPCGSAGDFGRSLGIHAGNAAGVIGKGNAREIDAARAVPTGAAPRFFVNMASAGLGGEVARSRSGGYLWRALRALALRGPYRIQIDGEEQVLLHLAAGICERQGRGMLVCPGADPADGLLDVTSLRPLGWWELARDLRMLYDGRIYRQPKVSHRRAARLSLDSGERVPFETDGEPAGWLPVEIEVVPRALLVLAP